MSELTLQLDSPITDEQWDAITDVNFERTHNIWFHTKSGKDVEFVKVIRCKDCKHWRQQTNYQGVPLSFGFCESDDMWRSLDGETYEVSHIDTDDDFYCGYAKRRTDGRSNQQTGGD